MREIIARVGRRVDAVKMTLAGPHTFLPGFVTRNRYTDTRTHTMTATIRAGSLNIGSVPEKSLSNVLMLTLFYSITESSY